MKNKSVKDRPIAWKVRRQQQLEQLKQDSPVDEDIEAAARVDAELDKQAMVANLRKVMR